MKKNEHELINGYLSQAYSAITEASDKIVMAATSMRLDIEKKQPYRTPQWHHTVLWAGFAFVIGMLLGAGLMTP